MPQQPRARLTFDSILDASARILGELGYDALTTNGAAAVAGVAVGGVYAYFPNKETIVAELVRRTIADILVEIEQTFAAAGTLADSGEAIEQLVRQSAQVLARRRELLRVFFEQVPFLSDLDEVKTFPFKLFEIAWRSRAISHPGVSENNELARAYLYLLIPIGRWVPYAAIIDRPAWLSAEAAEEAMVTIFRRLLA
ncbi:MAG: TetR family transcriptional regulator [Myxococcales bacterium]